MIIYLFALFTTSYNHIFTDFIFQQYRLVEWPVYFSVAAWLALWKSFTLSTRHFWHSPINTTATRVTKNLRTPRLRVIRLPIRRFPKMFHVKQSRILYRIDIRCVFKFVVIKRISNTHLCNAIARIYCNNRIIIIVIFM